SQVRRTWVLAARGRGARVSRGNPPPYVGGYALRDRAISEWGPSPPGLRSNCRHCGRKSRTAFRRGSGARPAAFPPGLFLTRPGARHCPCVQPAKLKTIQEETQRAVRQNLGEKLFSTYARSGGSW